MRRLTKKIDGSLVFPPELVGVRVTPDNETIRMLLWRLSEYEDTELEPWECEKVKFQPPIPFDQFCGVPMETAIKVLVSYRSGLTVQLPCQIGQRVWLLMNGHIVKACVKGFLTVFFDKLRLRVLLEIGYLQENMMWDEVFGRTLFLTEEEAVEALNN